MLNLPFNDIKITDVTVKSFEIKISGYTMHSIGHMYV